MTTAAPAIPWNDAPAWAKYYAVNGDGSATWFSNKPAGCSCRLPGFEDLVTVWVVKTRGGGVNAEAPRGFAAPGELVLKGDSGVALGVLVTLANGEMWAFERCHGSRARSGEKRGPMGGLSTRAWAFPSAAKAKEKAEAWLASSGYEVAKVEVLPVEEVEAKAEEYQRNRHIKARESMDHQFVVETYRKWAEAGKDVSGNKYGKPSNYHLRLLVRNRILNRDGSLHPKEYMINGRMVASQYPKAEEWLKEAGLL